MGDGFNRTITKRTFGKYNSYINLLKSNKKDDDKLQILPKYIAIAFLTTSTITFGIIYQYKYNSFSRAEFLIDSNNTSSDPATYNHTEIIVYPNHGLNGWSRGIDEESKIYFECQHYYSDFNSLCVSRIQVNKKELKTLIQVMEKYSKTVGQGKGNYYINYCISGILPDHNFKNSLIKLTKELYNYDKALLQLIFDPNTNDPNTNIRLINSQRKINENKYSKLIEQHFLGFLLTFKQLAEENNLQIQKTQYFISYLFDHWNMSLKGKVKEENEEIDNIIEENFKEESQRNYDLFLTKRNVTVLYLDGDDRPNFDSNIKTFDQIFGDIESFSNFSKTSKSKRFPYLASISDHSDDNNNKDDEMEDDENNNAQIVMTRLGNDQMQAVGKMRNAIKEFDDAVISPLSSDSSEFSNMSPKPTERLTAIFGGDDILPTNNNDLPVDDNLV